MNKKILDTVFKNRVEKGGMWLHVYGRLLKHGNETVSYKINGQPCDMPFSFSGVYFSEKNADYDRQLGRICDYVKKQLGRPINIIDVGANIGDTVLNIGDKENKYLLVEGEESYNMYIQKNLAGYDYILEQVFCAESDDDGNNKSVVKDHGTAMIVDDENGTDLKVKTMDTIVDDCNFSPDVFKIDTDGFDFKVMRGAGRMMNNTKPVIFFEWTLEELLEVGEDPAGIFPYLNEHGYEDLIIFDNYGTLMCKASSSNQELLANLIDYTRTNNIHYYDVCAVHKDSVIKADDLYSYLRSF